MHFRVFLLCLLFFWNISYAQTDRLDSLRIVYLQENVSDSTKFESGMSYMIAQFRFNLDSARKTGFQLMEVAKKNNNLSWQATTNRLIGNTYAIGGKFNEALKYFLVSYNILLEINDPPGLTVTLNNIGTIYYEIGNYTQAQEYLLQSLKLAEEREDEAAASRALNNLGNVHNDQRNNQEALDYYTKSLQLKLKMGDRQRLPAAYNNIGLVYSNMGNHEMAIESLSLSSKVAEDLGDNVSMTRAMSNLGIEYSTMGEYNKALDLLNESIQIKSEINDRDGLAPAFLYRGHIFLEIKEYNKANQDCQRSLTMAKEAGALNLEKEACVCISSAQERLGNYKLALEYHQKYLVLKDSLFNKEKTQEITRNELNYKFEKQQLADSITFHKLQTEQQVAYEKDINKAQNKFYITLIFGILLVSLFGFLYWKYQQNLKYKNLENKLLSSEVEFKKKDLVNLAVNISNNQEWAESLAEKLSDLKNSTGRKRAQELEDLETEIKNKIWVNKESDEFYTKIDELSSSFYNKLNSQFSDLTKNEIRLCSLIKLDLNTKQIAILQNIEPASVKMSRNRLRKKLNLLPEDDLNAFLRAF